MGSNRLGEAASFELPNLAGLLGAAAGNGPDAAKGTLQVPHKSVMFPVLQVLRLQDNSIRNIQGLQLYGFTGELLWISGVLLCLNKQVMLLAQGMPCIATMTEGIAV